MFDSSVPSSTIDRNVIPLDLNVEAGKSAVTKILPYWLRIEETEYRVLSMYMLAQYFVHKNNKTPDLEFNGLLEIYNNVRNVNKNFVKRLKDIVEKDSNLNALITLDCFAQSFDAPRDSIDPSMISNYENIFEPYL